MLYDIFISHTREDKGKFVLPLVKRLRDNHIEAWYDKFASKSGDSICKFIDMILLSLNMKL